MRGTIITVIGLIIGAMVFGFGLYYLKKSGDDAESKKIYGITMAVGAAIVIALVVKIIIAGF